MAGKIRKLFTNKDIEQALTEAKNDYVQAAQLLTNLGRGQVSRQLVRYWARHLTEVVKKNGEPYIGTTVLDRKIRNEEVELRTRDITDDDKIGVWAESLNSRVLIINDTHAPYVHPDAIAFLTALDERYKFDRVIHGGDETDQHALSFHDSDPNLDSAGAELAKARAWLHKLHALFPVMDICHSNHGSLVYRRAFKAGIPVEMLKTYREILFPGGGGEGWSWHEDVRFTLPNGEDCLVKHEAPGSLLSNAAHERANFIQGHRHSQWVFEGNASDAALYWGMLPGCLLDRKSRAFDYGKLNLKRPAIGVGMIINSLPQLMPMPLDSHGRWTGKLLGAE